MVITPILTVPPIHPNALTDKFFMIWPDNDKSHLIPKALSV